MTTGDNREIEIKLRIPDAASGRLLLERAGYHIIAPRVYEANIVFDTPGRDLRARGELLRLRTAGQRHIVTFKGRARPGPHKDREELEVAVTDAAAFEQILNRLGLEPVFRYEKYRTEYQQPGGQGTATLDETPIGDFLELEGPPAWIDASAVALGFLPSQYLTASYGQLYLDYCRENNVAYPDMVVGLSKSSEVPEKK